MKSSVLNAEKTVDKILYQPLNFSKTLQSLDILNASKGLNKDKILTIEGNQKYNNIHALIAEDNMINQKLIQRILKGLGLDVTLANDGAEALALRKQNEYDIIFMDIQMPVMGGIEATKAILEFENVNSINHIPIIALTANALAGDREKYIAAGMDNYIPKPIVLNKLTEVLEIYFSNNRFKKDEKNVSISDTKVIDFIAKEKKLMYIQTII